MDFPVHLQCQEHSAVLILQLTVSRTGAEQFNRCRFFKLAMNQEMEIVFTLLCVHFFHTKNIIVNYLYKLTL